MNFSFTNYSENGGDDFTFSICDCCKNNINFIEDNVKLCYECGVILCESCNTEFDGYCKDCYKEKLKELNEENEERWSEFWDSRF